MTRGRPAIRMVVGGGGDGGGRGWWEWKVGRRVGRRDRIQTTYHTDTIDWSGWPHHPVDVRRLSSSDI